MHCVVPESLDMANSAVVEVALQSLKAYVNQEAFIARRHVLCVCVCVCVYLCFQKHYLWFLACIEFRFNFGVAISFFC